MLKAGEVLKLRMVSPIKGEVVLREVGSDGLTFHEVLKDQVYREVVSRVRKCESVIDLGANIGLSSLYFAARYPSSRIFAVEPDPRTYELLEQNVAELKQEGRCQTLRAAVWGTQKKLVMQQPRGEDHFSAFTTREATDTQSSEETVTGVSILDIIKESGFETVDVLKIDIEGAETELFRGQSDWLRSVRAIAIEFHGTSRQDCDFDRLMSQYGFRTFDDGSHTVLALKND